MQRKEDVVREWHHYDAEGKILGRLAVEVAKKLMGKEKLLSLHILTEEISLL